MDIGFLIAKTRNVLLYCDNNHCGTTGCLDLETPSWNSVERNVDFLPMQYDKDYRASSMDDVHATETDPHGDPWSAYNHAFLWPTLIEMFRRKTLPE